MKQLIKLSIIAAISVALPMTSCKKYDEGPGFSLASKKSRVDGTWKIERATYSGTDITSEFEGVEWTMKKDGTFNLLIDGTTETGKWEFLTDKTILEFVFNDGSIEKYTIKRLTNKELWIELDDFGDILEFRLAAK